MSIRPIGLRARVRARGLSALGLLGVLGAALLAVPAVAGATAPYPPTSGCALSTSSSSVSGGGSLAVHGSGFRPGVTVQLELQSSGAALGSATTGPDGTFDITVPVPPAVASTDRVTATSGNTTCSFDPFAGGGTSDSSTGSTGDTASTGFRTVTATAIAVGLVVGGFALVWLGRRRRAG